MSAQIINGLIHIKNEITALDIAHKLSEVGGKLVIPTLEQRAIIESKHFGPAVIIAGAGSGKTETISQRVLWLVANGVVAPQEILGLTFTRKAASELAGRIRIRLRQLRKAGLLPSGTNLTPVVPIDISVDVATYHSYAGRTLSQHGLRMGIDTDGEPLGEAAAWQLTNEIVNSFADVEYGLHHKPNYIVDAVMTLSGELGEHNRTIEEIRSFLEDFHAQLIAVPPPSNDVVRSAIKTIEERLSILPMVQRVDEDRLQRNQLTFSDQMSYAAKLVETVPEISEIERSKYKVILLDEYQDTSYSQIRFLSSLFGGGHCVTAVGDPNQAIYGWRGASAETMGTFAKTFGGNCQEFDLLTTWRNDKKILDFSNIIARHIGSLANSRLGVKELIARDVAGLGNLVCGLYVTPLEEAEAIADYFATLWSDPSRLAMPEPERSSFAVLVRAKSYIPTIESALRDRGLPTEVVGVTGLIHTPEIADIIALLRLITFPDAGTALARLLVGPRLSLGPKDLAALGSYSRDLARKSNARRSDRLEEILETGGEQNLDDGDFAIGSIIEALELIDGAPRSHFSHEGFTRLKEFADELSSLRRALTGSITDQIQEAERFLHLDVETMVRDGWEIGRRHLDKFLDEAASFERSGGTLSAFLTWLETAERNEGGLKPASITVNNHAVQLLTVHAAKGAEWDVVAVPGLMKGLFPNTYAGGSSWIKSPGTLPIKFRGDHLQFTDFEFPRGDDAAKASEVSKAITRFEDSQKARRHLEELRLGYVAFTRAKSHLFCSASWFREGKSANPQSELFTLLYDFLEATDKSAIVSHIDEPDENPLIINPRTTIWPAPQSRAEQIQRSAHLVESSPELDVDLALSTERDPERLSLLQDAKALMEEITRDKNDELIYLPSRLSVSTLIGLKSNPDELSLNIRRPMPRHTDQYAKRGTEFHLWVERQFGAITLFDEDLFDPMPINDVALLELQTKWLASSWATRTPISVEEGFETVIAGVVLRGRIDAVYRRDDTYEIIDWKTGRIKEGDDLESATIQLAMYRLAYSKLHQIPIEKIRAGFYYVAEDRIIYREQLGTEEEIAVIIESVELHTN